MIYLTSPSKVEGVIHLPMIDFSLRKTHIDLSVCDILMFTSKQAVMSAEALNKEWKNIPCLAIGSATANTIESLGGSVIHQPSSFYGEKLSEDIIKLFKDKNILYLRPKVVSFDSKTFLAKAGIDLKEEIIYETFCIEYEVKDKPEKNSIIIFTSPSTIHCFLKNFIWDESYRAVSIGESTNMYLPQNSNYKVADVATIDSCIVKAKQLLTANRL